ncbi:MAG: hypothetical protein R3D25_16290 [Geminicoccaceae bacterium]
MDRNTLDLHHRTIRREGLVDDLAPLGTVQRVGDNGAQIRGQVGMDAAADLLVRREAEPHRPVRDVRVRHQMLRHGHDDRDAGLVVGAEQRRAAGRDNVVADPGREIGQGRRRQHHRRVVRQDDVAALVGPVHDRLHPGAGELRRRVDMRQEGYGWRLGRDGRRDRRQHRAVTGLPRIRKPDPAQLAEQEAQEILLLRRAGRGRGGRIGLGVDADIALEALEKPRLQLCSHDHPVRHAARSGASP